MGAIELAKKLSQSCDSLTKSILKQTNLAHVTNPLNYAWEYHESYLSQYSDLGATTLMLGMNPGPYGICLLYTSPSPRDRQKSRMPSSA